MKVDMIHLQKGAGEVRNEVDDAEEPEPCPNTATLKKKKGTLNRYYTRKIFVEKKRQIMRAQSKICTNSCYTKRTK